MAAGRRVYVTALHADRAEVDVGHERDLYAARLRARDVRWSSEVSPGELVRCAVKIRYRHRAAPAVVVPGPRDDAEVAFDTPQKAITPGQAAVFYDGDRVLGGGWIEAADA